MLNIAKTIYAAWNLPSKYDLPEAEVIPLGNSTNEKRKLENITKKNTAVTEHDNVPLPGFTLYTSNRKNWGSLDQTWLVIDPRGFLVRITNENLESILHVTGITEGLIQEKCVWARDNTATKMSLIPVSSPKYIEAVENTELIEGRVDLKDVQIGDTVLLQNKLTGIYMGVASLYGPMSHYRKTENKPQSFLRRQIIEVEPGKYHYQADLKILKVVDSTSTPMTREESVKMMNDDIASGIAYFTSGTRFSTTYYGTSGMIKHVSTHAVPKVPLKFEEVDLAEATSLFKVANTCSDMGMLVLTVANRNYVVDFPYSYNNKINSSSFPVIEIQNKIEDTFTINADDKKKSIFSYNTSATMTYSLDNFKKFYKIVKYVKNETYI
jgi:hypothetical protein